MSELAAIIRALVLTYARNENDRFTIPRLICMKVQLCKNLIVFATQAVRRRK
jgi:hypothetical protein